MPAVRGIRVREMLRKMPKSVAWVPGQTVVSFRDPHT